MTPSQHKEQPVGNFLCEDFCVCGHAEVTVQVRHYYSEGCCCFCCTPFQTLPLSYSLCSILSLLSCHLRLLSRCPASFFFSVWPLYSVHHPTYQSTVASSQHPVLSHSALACPHSLLQLLFPFVCQVVCCYWYYDMWWRTLMIFCFHCNHTGFPHLRVHIDHLTNQFME